MNINNFGLLNSLYNITNNGEQDNDYAIATFILHNIHRIQELTINEIVDEAHITRSAVRRFCHRIGYENFSEIKNSFNKIAFPSNLNFRSFSSVDTYRKLRHIEITEMLKDIDNQISNDEIYEITSLLMDYNQIIIVCANNTSSSLIKFQQELLFVGKIVFVISDVYKENRIVDGLDKDSLVIVVSTSGTFAKEASDWIESLSSYKVLITANRNEEISNLYHRTYQLSQSNIENDLSGVYGKYAIVYLFDLIAENYFFTLQEKNLL